MYVEIKTNDVGELHQAFESAMVKAKEGRHMRLTLDKDGDFYVLSCPLLSLYVRLVRPL